MVFIKRKDENMNEKDLFKGINLLKEECERSDNSLVVNVWHNIVTGKQIGRASCRERVSSPV